MSMYYFPCLSNLFEIWEEKYDIFLLIHNLVNDPAKKVGKDPLVLTDTLLIGYVLSGCDSVSYPFKRGKRKAAKVALQHIGEMPALFNAKISDFATKEHVMDEARIFFCELYGKPGYSSLDKLRAHLFASSKLDLRSRSLTEDAFHFHVLRSLYQLNLYKQASLSNPELLQPEHYGRSEKNERLVPVMMNKPPKPATAKLSYSKCKKKKKNKLPKELSLCESKIIVYYCLFLK